MRRGPRREAPKIRYAVVGLGSIAQMAVLPAFAHARRNSELVALVSGDAVKREVLGKKYRVERLCSYEDYDALLRSGEIDAVYIALPNHLHREFSVRAAEAGIHVLCEKPMAFTKEDCRDMIRAAAASNVRLMVAYRLHFEKANLAAVRVARSGRLGEPKIFTSAFTMQVRDPGNVRLKRATGGGTLYDIGIYCINAARYLFRSEPEEVVAFTGRGEDPRFSEVEETASAVLRFPEGRLATFTCSFGAADASWYELIGPKGSLRVEAAYDYAEKMALVVRGPQASSRRTFGKRDQFGPELVYFSDCVRERKEPEPSGTEGLADVRVIRALYESARIKRAVLLAEFDKRDRPEPGQEISRPGIREPEIVHAQSPGGED